MNVKTVLSTQGGAIPQKALLGIMSALLLKGGTEEDIWNGTIEMMETLTNFRNELKTMSSGHTGAAIKINLPPLPEFRGTRSKIYKIWANSTVREIIQIICKKVGIEKSDRCLLTTLSGQYILENRDQIGSYGFGTLLPSWELNFAIAPLSTPLFGASIPSSFTRQVHTESPHILVQTIEVLKARGLDEPNLLSAPFSKGRVIQLKKRFEHWNADGIQLFEQNVHDVAALLMLYLAQLPTPLFPKSFENLVPFQKLEGEDKKEQEKMIHEKIRNCIESSSTLDNELIRYFLDFLSQIHSRGHVSAEVLAKLLVTRLFFPLEARKKEMKAKMVTQTSIGLVRTRYSQFQQVFENRDKEEEKEKDETSKGEKGEGEKGEGEKREAEKEETEKRETEKETEKRREGESGAREISPRRKRKGKKKPKASKRAMKSKDKVERTAIPALDMEQTSRAKETEQKSETENRPRKSTVATSTPSKSPRELLVKSKSDLEKPGLHRTNKSNLWRYSGISGSDGGQKTTTSSDIGPFTATSASKSDSDVAWKRPGIVSRPRKLERADTHDIFEAITEVQEIEKQEGDYQALLEFMILHINSIFPDRSLPFTLLAGTDFLQKDKENERIDGNAEIEVSVSVKKMKTKQIDALIASLEREKQFLEQTLRERDERIIQLSDQLNDRDGRIGMLDEELKEKIKDIGELEERVASRDERVVELEGECERKEEERKRIWEELEGALRGIGERDLVLRERGEELVVVRSEMDLVRGRLQDEVEGLEGSLSEAKGEIDELGRETDTLKASIADLNHQLSNAQSALAQSNDLYERETTTLGEKIELLHRQLVEKDRSLLESEEADQAMKKMIQSFQEQIENLRGEVASLKKTKKDLEEELKETKETIIRNEDKNERLVNDLKKDFSRREQQRENEKKAILRENERVVDTLKRDIASKEQEVVSVERQFKTLQEAAKEAEQKAKQAQERLDSHLCALSNERKKCAAAERRNWLLKNEHSEAIRRLKKELSLSKKEHERLQARVEELKSSASVYSGDYTPRTSLSSATSATSSTTTTSTTSSSTSSSTSSGPPPPPPTVTAPPLPKDTENVPTSKLPTDLGSLLSVQKTKLAKVKDEPSPHPIPVSASSTSLGGTIMASLAHRFQTIRQLESEDLRSERGDDDLSGFEDDDDDDESYFY